MFGFYFVISFHNHLVNFEQLKVPTKLIEAGRQFFSLQFPRTLKKFRNRGSQIVLFVAHQVNNKKTQLDEGDVYLFSFFKFFFLCRCNQDESCFNGTPCLSARRGMK